MSSQFNDPDPNEFRSSDNVESSNQSSSLASSSSSFNPKQTKISNLTKNLLSTKSNIEQETQDSQAASHNQVPNNPPSYDTLVSTSHNENTHLGSGGEMNQSGHYYYPNRQSYNSQFVASTSDSMNYIPTGHHTPNAISSSYSSNHSYNTPHSYNASTNNFVPQNQLAQQQQQQNFTGSYKPNGMMAHAIPTTNVSMDSANSFNSSSLHKIYSHQNASQGDQFNQQYSKTNQLNFPQQRYQPNSLPNNNGGNSFGSFNSFQQSSNPKNKPMSNQTPIYQYSKSQSDSSSSIPDHNSRPSSYIPSEPDHYMTYKEFLHSLSIKDSEAAAAAAANSSNNESNDSIHDEHLNIVDYPVNDLILMLSCLLSKIIEANDKLHPNHFDNTIAIRQKYKEEKKLRKLEKENRRRQRGSTGDDAINVDDSISVDANSDIDIEEDDADEEEEDEMKNKYLANVLAFHGTNVPGISLHAYLARVLKYCPVTNEVFLSLLVYFDRIAKKANNLKLKKKKQEEEGNKNEDIDDESEQLFVMDSYNIHRLIISGITVSSKFFSDIFYKNLRYAKVGGLPLEELNYLELQFLLLLDFKLMISVEDLQNYGDLLLKFWKREQLTNELVSGTQESHSQSETPSQNQGQTQTQSQLVSSNE